MCQIVCILAPAGTSVHKRPVGVLLLSLPDTKNASPAPYWTELASIIEVPSVDYEKLSSDNRGETSETIRKRVQAARDIQNKRFANWESKDIVCNADMRVRDVRQFCQLKSEVKV